jgi:hypothetical protein
MGTPIACAAVSISRAAEALTTGSTSEAFSGQITRSGAAARPPEIFRARVRVALTWLRSTASRWALNSSPSWGTLPCTTATLTRAPSGWAAGRARPTTVATAAAAVQASTGTARRSRPG